MIDFASSKITFRVVYDCRCSYDARVQAYNLLSTEQHQFLLLLMR